MAFSWFDIIIGILMLVLALRGLLNGLVREFFGLAGIVGGVFVASIYAEQTGSWISENVFTFANPSAISLVGFLALLVAIWVGAIIIAEILQKLIDLSRLGVFNRILGFVFGGAKVFMVIAIIIAAFSNINFARNWIESKAQGSYLHPILLKSGQAVLKLDLLPDDMREQVAAKASDRSVGQAIGASIDGIVSGAVEALNGATKMAKDVTADAVNAASQTLNLGVERKEVR